MKKIKILGPGCAKCTLLYENTSAVAKEIGLECEIEKVSDMQEILNYGVMITPALVVDEVVKVSGKVPSNDDLKAMITA